MKKVCDLVIVTVVIVTVVIVTVVIVTCFRKNNLTH